MPTDPELHTDPELLSLLALGETASTEDDRIHAHTCPYCAGELAQLHRVVTLGRSTGPDTRLATPSPQVWARIHDEVAFHPAPEPPTRRPTSLPLEAPGRPAAAAPPNATIRRPVHRPARQRLLAIIKAAVAGSSRRFRNEPTAHARLRPVELAWSHASGQAELATDEHGRRLLQVTLNADLPASGLRQAWLVHRDQPELRQSLGVLDGPYGLWTVDHSIDLDDYTILDISQQAPGQTDHSGHTIVRGQLTLAS